ncbi:MAG: alpha/beta fold hydrolase [Candidatus Binataceae bacterium]
MLNTSEQLEHLKLSADYAGLEIPQFILPESRQTILGRMRFHYLDWGNRGRHPLLFLHGGGLNAHTWDLVCLMLRNDYHCLALDQRGHGDSEWEPTADYRFDTQVRDIERFVAELSLSRPLIIGHSMGGFAAMGYAVKHAKSMAGLVLVDVAPELNLEGAVRIREFINQDRELESVEAFIERALKFNPRRNRELLRRSLLHNLRQLPNGKWTWKHDPNRIGTNFEHDRAERASLITNATARITCPTLVMRGEHSNVLTDESARKFAESLPAGSWVRIPDSGHTIQGDNPRALLSALRPFLREIGL